MREFDVIVIGSGAGMSIAANALGIGLRVALVDHGPLGGTCLNNGCIPSKVLLYPADVVRQLQDAAIIGVAARAPRIDFARVMRRMRSYVDEGREEMERGVAHTDALTWYRDTGQFVGDYTMQVGAETITAPKIIIAAGARPLVPPIEGLEAVGYLDNVSVLQLARAPRSLAIIGGGFIAAEYAHFFSAVGCKTVILERNPRILKGEEPDISEIVQRRLGRYVDIRVNYEVVKVEKTRGGKMVTAIDRTNDKVYRFKVQEVMLAAGRRANTDLLKPERTGVQTDARGWIVVNEYLETTKPNIWALGDAIGKHMFRHTANYEADVVWTNAFGDHKHQMDYHAVPHAVFTHPQVGSVGMTQAQAEQAGLKIMVGMARYMDVAKGYAMGELDTLVKVIVEQKTGRILGCHIAGPEAAVLVQAITYLMHAGDQDYMPLALAQTIHPALSEVVVHAFGNLAPVGGAHAHDHAREHDHEEDEGHSHET